MQPMREGGLRVLNAIRKERERGKPARYMGVAIPSRVEILLLIIQYNGAYRYRHDESSERMRQRDR